MSAPARTRRGITWKPELKPDEPKTSPDKDKKTPEKNSPKK